MASDQAGVFGPEAVRRMGRAYQYAHDLVEQRDPDILRQPGTEQELARGIIETAKSDKNLPRQLVRSVVERVLQKHTA